MLEAGGHRVLVGGNIGLALSAQVDDSTEDTIHVVETSSFQLESAVTFHPWIAVLLNFSPDHLDRHADLAEYAAAKARIFANQAAGDWAVLNADDEPSHVLAQEARSRRLLFSVERELREGILIAGDAIVRRSGGSERVLVPLSAVKLLGRHLLADVLAAAAVASIAGVEPDAMRRAVEGFTGLEHALEPVAEIHGVRFVNDSKATNIESALRAIQSFPAGLVVILGGRFKGGTFADLREALVARAARAVAIGEAAPLVREALQPAVPVHGANDMPAAVRTAFAVAAPGETVLLAPACASFDMFRDYAERGRVFKQEVSRLQREWNSGRQQ
jgi:UDP-N-acetylmuramoylalanine--D-glutamate ligase